MNLQSFDIENYDGAVILTSKTYKELVFSTETYRLHFRVVNIVTNDFLFLLPVPQDGVSSKTHVIRLA